MQFESYGDQNGTLVIYFHGAPGSPKEAAFFEHAALGNKLHILCFDRFSIEKEITGNAYYLMLADIIEKHRQSHRTVPDQVHLVGFSIGCHVALEVSICLSDKVASLHLISAAAPLDGGDFLNSMAGKPVFQLAKKVPFLFSLLTGWQSLVFRISPSVVFNMLFASAQGKDAELVKNDTFKSQLTGILTSNFLSGSQGYVKDVAMYVQPWQHKVTLCSAPTYLWHGDADNWSPVGMASYLASALPNCKGKQVLAGASHYSCLLESVPKVCAAIAGGK